MNFNRYIFVLIFWYLFIQAPGLISWSLILDRMNQNQIIDLIVEERLELNQFFDHLQPGRNLHVSMLDTLTPIPPGLETPNEPSSQDSGKSEAWQIFYTSTQGHHSLPAFGLLILLGILTGLVFGLFEHSDDHSNEKQ